MANIIVKGIFLAPVMKNETTIFLPFWNAMSKAVPRPKNFFLVISHKILILQEGVVFFYTIKILPSFVTIAEAYQTIN